MASIFVSESSRIIAVLEQAQVQLTAMSALPEAPDTLFALAVAQESAGNTHSAEILRAQAACEERFLSAGGLDTVMVRDQTKVLLQAVVSKTVALPSSGLRRVGGAGHGTGGDHSSAHHSSGLASLASLLGDVKALVRTRLEGGGESARQDSERSLNLQSRIAAAEREAAALRAKLAASRAAREAETTAVAAQMEKLHAEIAEVKTKGAQNEEALTTYKNAQTSQLQTTHQTKMQELTAELARLQGEFVKAVEADEAAAAGLRKRRNHVRGELARVITEYDRDLLAVTEKIEKISQLLAAEKSQLDILRPHFALVDANSKAKAEEEEATRRRREAERSAYEAAHVLPARRIQRWYRKRLAATDALKKSSKKKRGKSKGKGKGKKGKK